MVDAKVQRAADGLIGRILKQGSDRFSAVLYGSAARGEYRPGQSDVNVLVVFEELSPVVLRALGSSLSDQETPPLLFTRDEWSRATDSFPIEVTDMRLAYEVLHGSDPIAGLTVDPLDLRRALEREARGKLIRLRQGYAACSTQPARLGELMAASAGTLGLLWRCSLVLLQRPVPAGTMAVIDAIADHLALDRESLAHVQHCRDAASPSCSPNQFESLLAAMAQATRALDTLSLGAS